MKLHGFAQGIGTFFTLILKYSFIFSVDIKVKKFLASIHYFFPRNLNTRCIHNRCYFYFNSDII